MLITFHHCDKILEKKQLKREKIYLASVSEGPVHDCLALLLWAWEEAELMWTACVGPKSLTSWLLRGRETERSQHKIHSSRACPPWLISSNKTLYLSFHHLRSCYQTMTPSMDWPTGEVRSLMIQSFPRSLSADKQVFSTSAFRGLFRFKP
jgi:hypothetical protein